MGASGEVFRGLRRAVYPSQFKEKTERENGKNMKFGEIKKGMFEWGKKRLKQRIENEEGERDVQRG